MADLWISVYDSGRVREAFATLFDFQYTEFVGTVEYTNVDITRCISVYEDVTVVDAGIQFNEHLFTDPRVDYHPKLPVREGSGNFAKAASSYSLETPGRFLAARMGSVASSKTSIREIESEASIYMTLEGSGKTGVRIVTTRSGAMLNENSPTRDGAATCSGGELSLSLSKRIPGRLLRGSINSGGFMSLSKWSPGRSIAASMDTGGWGELDEVIPCRTLSATLIDNSDFTITGNTLLTPVRELEASMEKSYIYLSAKKSPPVVVLMELECEKPVTDYVLSYGG